MQPATPTPIPWHTPTPIPTANATVPVDFLNEEIGITLAESVVQGYQYSNQYGGIDTFIYGVLFIMVIGGVWSITNALKRMNGD